MSLFEVMDLPRMIVLLVLGSCYSGPQPGTNQTGGGTGATDSAGESESEGGDTAGPPSELGAPSSAVRRLSRREVDAVIQDVFGLSGLGTTHLPLDVLAPFDTDTENKHPSAVFVDGHEALAETVASTFASDPAAVQNLSGCTPSGAADADCMRQLVERLGRRLWRRPLADEEVAPLLALALEFASDESDFGVGAQLVAQALLLSPDFIYVMRVGEQAGEGSRALTPYEIGARLSFLILGTTPDDGLLDRLAEGPLTSDALVAIAEGLLDERAELAATQMVDFHTMWLGTEEPRVPSEHLDAASRETHALLRHVLVDAKLPWTELFLHPRTHVSTGLAAFYGLPAPAGEEGWIDYPDEAAQSGVLSHMSWLSQSALILDETSPVKRGKRVVEGLLCRTVPPPPPSVDVDNVQVPDTGCLSDFYAEHSQPGTSCFTCHATFEPAGHGLERWDAYGRPRTTEPGRPNCPISGEGELSGVGEFSGPRQLAELMVGSGELTTCLAERLIQFDEGRPLTLDDRPAVERIHERFVDANEDFRALILAYVADPVFRYRNDTEECQ